MAHPRPIPAFVAEDLTRLWARVDKSGGEAACWPWQGGSHKNGHGQIRIAGRVYYVHRVVYSVAVGFTDELKLVCHKCNNPPCCNPAHLYEGTHKDNARDTLMVGSLRKGSRRGARNPAARLSETDVAEVRGWLAEGVSKAEIARRKGVSRTAIYWIEKGRNWKSHA